MLLYGLTPHAHVRGGSTQVSVIFPDGREQLILAVPRYRFDWQCEYYLAEPILIPAGSRIINRWTYDNSTRNFANPAPEKAVIFGEQSWEEMLTFFIHYRWVGETVAAPLDGYDRLLQQGHTMGVLDDDLDGSLQPAELRGEAQESKRTALHHKLRVLIHPHARRGGHQTTCGAQHFAIELLQGVLVVLLPRDLLLLGS